MKAECASCVGNGSFGYYSTDEEGNKVWVDENCPDCDGSGVVDDED